MSTKPYVNDYLRQLCYIDDGRPVRVYRNLHTGLWSVKQGVVRFHTDCLFLKDVKFLVNEKVRQRVVKNKRKEVHAYVQGWLSPPKTVEGDEVTYNPYKNERFVCNMGEIDSAEFVCLKKLSGPKPKMAVFASGITLTSVATSRSIVDSVATHLL